MLNVVNVSPIAVPCLPPTHNVQGHTHSPARSRVHAQRVKPYLVLRVLTQLVYANRFTVFGTFPLSLSFVDVN